MNIFDVGLSPEATQEMAGARKYLEAVAAGREKRDNERIKSSVMTFCSHAAEDEIPKKFIQYAAKSDIDVSTMIDEAIAEIEKEDPFGGGDFSFNDAGPSNGQTVEPSQKRMLDLADETLIEMLSLHAQGKPWTDIAEHFGKDPRTIYNWRQEANVRGLSPFTDVSPSQYVAEQMDRLEQRRAVLAAKFDKAVKEDNDDVMIKLDKALSRIDDQAIRLLERAGFFSRGDQSQRDLKKPWYDRVDLSH